MTALSLHSHAFHAMGTRCHLHAYGAGPVEAASALAAAVAEVQRIEEKYSRYRPDSFLSAINAAAARGETVELDEESAALIDYAFACHRRSDGLFDVTSGILRRAWRFAAGVLPSPEEVAALLPFVGMDKLDWRPPLLTFRKAGMEIDLGGIGKEFAADRARAVLAGNGIRHGLVELGGDIAAVGPHPDGTPWRVGLRDPRRPGETFEELPLSGGGLATSGDYERCIEVEGRRYGHILDPRTGWPTEGLASATVTADCCMVAGSAATIAMLKGQAGGDWLESLSLPHVCIDLDGAVVGPAGARRPG